tara:strand:- start:619 stop:1392 length:774 start_codon:yes stop_codon:yes gene_type:complete
MKTIALIDADSLMYYEMGATTLEQAIEGINTRIFAILNEVNADEYTGFLTIGKCFRYNVAETVGYKHNRSGGMKPPIFYALKAYMQQTPLEFTYVDGLEADDCVAVYADVFRKQGHKVVICSPDKDVLLQLPGNHYNYQKQEWVKTTDEQAKDFLWKQTLMGDSTDGIPGIPGLGPKTADKIIDSLSSAFTYNYQGVVIEKYVEKFGLKEGICRFAETFNLVYLLRTPEEVLKYTGSPLPDLKLNVIFDFTVDESTD